MISTRLVATKKGTMVFCFILLSFMFINNRRSKNTTCLLNIDKKEQTFMYRRRPCSCSRQLSQQDSNVLIIDETSSSLCSQYSTLRGFHQRIISISMFGFIPKSVFDRNSSITYLYQLIADMNKLYPDWTLRVYHDSTIESELVCSIECTYDNVDFCNASSLGRLGSVSSFVPPKIWRFLPAGDDHVDIMVSRDLDSPLTLRELAAVDEWISLGKAWHTMRDHPMHFVVMLGKKVHI